MRPSRRQIERGAAAMIPFVQRWHLPLDPEDCDEIVYAILKNYDRQTRGAKLWETIEKDVNAQIDKFVRLNAFGRPRESNHD